MPDTKHFSQYKGDYILTDRKLRYPIHINNTIDKWCEGCGRKLHKKIVTTTRWNRDTGQKIVRAKVHYRCSRLSLPFTDIWSHTEMDVLYERAEA